LVLRISDWTTNAQEQLSDQDVTEEILPSELPIQNMQMEIPASELGLPVAPATWTRLFNDPEAALTSDSKLIWRWRVFFKIIGSYV
jgi:hypothetical protein